MELNSSGSSLLEVLIVLVLLSLLAGLGIYSSRQLLARPALKLQAQELLAVLASTEQQALYSGNLLRLQFDVQQGIIWKAASASPSAPPQQTVLLRLQRSVRFEHVAFGVGGKSLPVAVYYGSGVVSPGTIVMTDDDNGRCVIAQGLRGNRHLECKR